MTTAKKLNLRFVVRTGFLFYFIYLCAKLWMFYLWAVGEGAYVDRPEAVAGLIPVGAYMSFFLWLKTGFFDVVAPAGIIIIVGALATSFLFKRGFCGWICPVGAVWHGFGWLGRRLQGRTPRLPRGLDLVLRGVRYLIAAAVLTWIAMVPVAEAISFQQIPYYAVSDIKILSLLVRLGPIYLAVAGLIAVSSMLLGNTWCRYLCPLGGLYGAIGAASPCTVVRDAEKCIDCGKCTEICHAGVKVDTLVSVHAPECDGCQDCVIECPAPGALEPRIFGRWAMPVWLWPVLVVGVWIAIYAAAELTGHWDTAVPPELFKAYILNLGI
ncbi:MAG: 4Fe-4S binding protein [Actinomycetota bacterium]|nr:4Fe-4S binding protein [Actinomycetota bacterium]